MASDDAPNPDITQVRILDLLRWENGPLTQHEIASKLDLELTDVTLCLGALQSLEKVRRVLGIGDSVRYEISP